MAVGLQIFFQQQQRIKCSRNPTVNTLIAIPAKQVKEAVQTKRENNTLALFHDRIIAVPTPGGLQITIHSEELPVSSADPFRPRDVLIHKRKELKIGWKHDVTGTKRLQIGR